MKKLSLVELCVFILPLFFVPSSTLYSQINTFNKSLIFTHDTVDERCSGVVEVNGRFFIACTILNRPTGDWIGIAEVDSAGNKIRTTIIGDSIHAYSTGWYNGLNKTSDGNLILTGTYHANLDTVPWVSRIMLMKLSCEGQILWMNTNLDTIYNQSTSRGETVIETADHGFAVIGQIGIMGILYKTDSAGNVLWFKNFGSGQTTRYEYLSSITETLDSGFLIGTYRYNGHVNQSGDPWVYRLNKSGSAIWQRPIGGPHPDGGAFPIQQNDSTVIVLSHYTTKAAWFGQAEEIKLRVLTMRFSNGYLITDSMYGEQDNLYHINQVFRMHDGTYRACGSVNYGNLAWIFGYNDKTDSLFLRDFECDPEKNGRFDTLRYFHGAIPCSDGGILSVGTYYLVYKGVSRGNGWIVKTDKYGCMDMGCDSNAIYMIDQPEDTTLCKDQNATLTIGVFGGNPSYQWQFLEDSVWKSISDTVIYGGICSSSLTIDLSALPLSCYNYRVKVYNDLYAYFSQSAELYILDTVSFLVQPQDQVVKKMDTAIFTVHAFGMEPMVYRWYRNGEQLASQITDTLIIPSVSSADTGIYFCKVSNPCGQEDSRFCRLSINYASTGTITDNQVIFCYPNPASSNLIVNTNTKGTANILNLNGQTIVKHEIIGPTTTIDVSNLPSGMYTVKIIGEKGLQVGKFVKE